MKTLSVVIVTAFAVGAMPVGCAAPAGVDQTATGTATTQATAAPDAVILLKGLT